MELACGLSEHTDNVSGVAPALTVDARLRSEQIKLWQRGMELACGLSRIIHG